MLTITKKKALPKDHTRKALCSGLLLLLIALVALGIAYCLLTQAEFVPGLSPQGPIGFR
ncbi:MAG: hypothetical protein ACP5OS_05945 [Leptospirillia bacterium]